MKEQNRSILHYATIYVDIHGILKADLQPAGNQNDIEFFNVRDYVWMSYDGYDGDKDGVVRNNMTNAMIIYAGPNDIVLWSTVGIEGYKTETVERMPITGDEPVQDEDGVIEKVSRLVGFSTSFDKDEKRFALKMFDAQVLSGPNQPATNPNAYIALVSKEQRDSRNMASLMPEEMQDEAHYRISFQIEDVKKGSDSTDQTTRAATTSSKKAYVWDPVIARR